MQCSSRGCNQEVMPKVDKSKPSLCYWYRGAACPDKIMAHWAFGTRHEEKPLCYYHEKVAEGKFNLGYSK